MDWVEGSIVMLIPIITVAGSIGLIGVIMTMRHKRRERETYYRYELAKQLVEKGDADQEVVSFLKDDRADQLLMRRRVLVLVGLLLTAAGIGFFIAFRAIEEDMAAIGAIPFTIGAALSFYGMVLMPRIGAGKTD